MRALTGSVRFNHMPWFLACSPQSRPLSMCQMLGAVAIQSGPGSMPDEAVGAVEGAGTPLVLGVTAAAVGGAVVRSKSSSNGVFMTSGDATGVAAAVAVAWGVAGVLFPASNSPALPGGTHPTATVPTIQIHDRRCITIPDLPQPLERFAPGLNIAHPLRSSRAGGALPPVFL
jgi:hypothetical protein